MLILREIAQITDKKNGISCPKLPASTVRQRDFRYPTIIIVPRYVDVVLGKHFKDHRNIAGCKLQTIERGHAVQPQLRVTLLRIKKKR